MKGNRKNIGEMYKLTKIAKLVLDALKSLFQYLG